MVQNKEIKVQLTESTLENNKIMAPLLDEASQNQLFGMMFGMLSGISKDSHTRKQDRLCLQRKQGKNIVGNKKRYL